MSYIFLLFVDLFLMLITFQKSDYLLHPRPITNNIAKDRKAALQKTGKSLSLSNYANGVFEAKQLWALSGKKNIADDLNYILSQPFIKKIMFSDTAQQNISIHGNITVPPNKILEFDGSVILSQCNINGGIINAPIGKQIFDTSVSLYNTSVTCSYFSAGWFGLNRNNRSMSNCMLQKYLNYTPQHKTLWIPDGDYIISKTLQVTKSIEGDSNTTFKYIPSNSSGNDVMIQVTKGNLSIKSLTLDGNKKALWIIEVLNGQKNVAIEHCNITGAEQTPGSKAFAAGIRFREGMDGLHIHGCRVSSINASVTGVARGIIGSGRISPQNVIIENNIFDGVTNEGAQHWDADQIVIQDYTDSTGMIIRNNKHFNISKRGQKLQAPGIYSYQNEFRSNFYKQNKQSYSAISVYGNGVTVDGNIIEEGIFETGIEIGNKNATYSNIKVQNNKLNISPGNMNNNDGIRVFGKANSNISITGNNIENVRMGIWLDCGSNNTTIEYNTITNAANNAICTQVISNKWPDTWNNNINVKYNKASNIKSYFAFNFSNIRDGVIAYNTAEFVNALINTQSLDSINGKVKIFENKGPQSINYGPASQKPIIKSEALFGALEYYNTDTKRTEIFDGNKWIRKKEN
ncbi:MAG: right-handed parallel beta-helix repeat-containing protein [Agriterribacter sp.]